MHKVGIIGFGGMGRGWHTKQLPKTGRAEVVAAYDINPEKVNMAREQGLIGYAGLRINSVKHDTKTIEKPQFGGDGAAYFDGVTSDPALTEARVFYNAILKGQSLLLSRSRSWSLHKYLKPYTNPQRQESLFIWTDLKEDIRYDEAWNYQLLRQSKL